MMGRSMDKVTYACAAGCGQLVVQQAHSKRGGHAEAP